MPTRHLKNLTDRQERKPERVAAVADSIKREGIKHPLAVNVTDAQAWLANGHHRLAAAKKNRLRKVPVTVREGAYKTWEDPATGVSKVITPQSRQLLREQGGDLVTPTGRKKVVTQVVVTEAEMGLRRQKRKLARMDPEHPAVRAAIRKARGADLYDRDASGRFAEHESRPVTARGPQLLERPVEAPEPETVNLVDADEQIDLFADLGVELDQQVDLDASVELDVGQQIDLLADEQVDLFGPPALGTGTGSGQMIIIINGKPERVPDDELIMAPVEYYSAVFARPIRRADWNVDENFSRYSTGGVRQPTAAEVAESGFPVESMRPVQDLPNVITSADIGKVVDFDAWQRRLAVHNKDRDFPGFPAKRVADHDMLLDVVHHGVDETREDWSELEEEYYQYRSEAQEAAWREMEYAVPQLSDDEIRSIFLEAGRSQDVRDFGAQELRERLLGVDGSWESDEDMALLDAYAETVTEQDPTIQALQGEMESRLGDPDQPFLRIPQIFSFKGGSFRQDRLDGSNEVRVHGKFRIADVRVHSFTREGIAIDQHTGRPKVVDHHVPNPRVAAWREVMLEPVDE